MTHETFDGNPCPGTCVTLADEGVEARAQLARMQEEQLVLLKLAEHAWTDAKYWMEQYAVRNAQHTGISQRARLAAGLIIGELGNLGPEDVDETAQRAVTALVARRERIDELEKQPGHLRRERLLRFSVCPACTRAIAWGPGAPGNDKWICTNQDCRLEGTEKNFTNPEKFPVWCPNCCGELAEPNPLVWDASGRVGPCEKCGWAPGSVDIEELEEQAATLLEDGQ